ncbi:MAG: MazG nucleotide pyrophosphohydrolase domain-containing protein [Polyangiales bacterium]
MTQRGDDDGALSGAPQGSSPLARAVWIDARAAEVGYDWPDAMQARSKIDEELGELHRAHDAGDAAEAEAELGDVLLSLVSFARKGGMDVHRALAGALGRFETRFAWAERTAAQRGRALADMTAEELDALWHEAKAAVG